MSAPAASGVANAQIVRLALFGIAMGLLEAIVVVYLRELYFPDGFRFPLRFIPKTRPSSRPLPGTSPDAFAGASSPEVRRSSFCPRWLAV